MIKFLVLTLVITIVIGRQTEDGNQPESSNNELINRSNADKSYSLSMDADQIVPQPAMRQRRGRNRGQRGGNAERGRSRSRGGSPGGRSRSKGGNLHNGGKRGGRSGGKGGGRKGGKKTGNGFGRRGERKFPNCQYQHTMKRVARDGTINEFYGCNSKNHAMRAALQIYPNSAPLCHNPHSSRAEQDAMYAHYHPGGHTSIGGKNYHFHWWVTKNAC